MSVFFAGAFFGSLVTFLVMCFAMGMSEDKQ